MKRGHDVDPQDGISGVRATPAPPARTHPIADIVADIAGDIVADAGMDLEELTVRLSGGRRLVRVVVDRDGGVDLEGAARISRAISAALDEHDSATGDAPFDLEVTSRGVGAPLTAPRHFRRARGRLVTISLASGATVQARIAHADQQNVTVLGGLDGCQPSTIALADIDRAAVDVEFSAVPAAVQAAIAALQDGAPGTGEPSSEGATR